MCFPLPLSVFERYMLADDRPDYPMTFFLRLHLSGEIRRNEFELALQRVVRRHPLLRAIVEEVDGVARWAPAPGVLPEVIWSQGGPVAPTPQVHLNIRRRSGLRLWAHQNMSEQTTTILCEFHHVCCDGVAAAQVVEEILVAYAVECGERHELQPLCPTRLCERESRNHRPLERLRQLGRCVLASLGIGQFLANRVAPIVARPPRERVRLPHVATSLTWRSGRNDLARLREQSRRRGVTVNDLLLERWFQALAEVATATDVRSREYLRISMPVNLRDAGDEAMSAANCVGMVFLDRSVRQARGRRLLWGIRLDTWFVKRFGLAKVFAPLTRLLEVSPGGFARLLQGPHCLATAVLSNLGPRLNETPLPRDAQRIVAANVTLEAIDFLPPVRWKTRAALGVISYAGRLQVSLHYDRTTLSPSAARGLFNRFVAGLRQTVEAIADAQPRAAASADTAQFESCELLSVE